LKEAYIKARGLGMALPVEKIEVTFEPGVPRGLRFFPPVLDAADRWALSTFEVDGHLISTCVETAADVRAVVAVRRADLSALLAIAAPSTARTRPSG
jgi:phosphopantetheinyl transferase